MTESDWMECCDPRKMVEFLRDKVSNRKMSLFVACCDPVGALPESKQEERMWCYDVQNIRDIFGNPFRPVTMKPVWLQWNDGTVAKLAQLIYDERRFEDMPILGDAFIDAGCHNEEILSHCRSEGPHVRGCWVVDLILNKE